MVIKKEMIIETDIVLEEGYGYYITPVDNKLCISRAKLPNRKPYGKYHDGEGNIIDVKTWKELFHEEYKELRRKEYELKSGGYKYGRYNPIEDKGGQNNGNKNTDSTTTYANATATDTSR
jgi:hypothetical protein